MDRTVSLGDINNAVFSTFSMTLSIYNFPESVYDLSNTKIIYTAYIFFFAGLEKGPGMG